MFASKPFFSTRIRNELSIAFVDEMTVFVSLRYSSSESSSFMFYQFDMVLSSILLCRHESTIHKFDLPLGSFSPRTAFRYVCYHQRQRCFIIVQICILYKRMSSLAFIIAPLATRCACSVVFAHSEERSYEPIAATGCLLRSEKQRRLPCQSWNILQRPWRLLNPKVPVTWAPSTSSMDSLRLWSVVCGLRS